MNNTRKSHRIIAIFFLLNFLQTFLPYNLLYANNNGPKSPEAASFEPTDASDMVNLTTGDFTYVLPILNVPSPEGGYPLTLAYHAGIPVGNESSWVGMGWNINPGAINRYVSGIPDDWKRTRKYSTIYNQGGVSTSYSGGVGVGLSDFLSVGVYASYSENKSFGGENSYDFNGGVNATIGLKGSNLLLSGSVGTDGIGAGISLKDSNPNNDNSMGISAYQSFKNSSTSVGINVTGSGPISTSMGVSFNTIGGLSLNSNFGSTTLSSKNSISKSLTYKNDIFSIGVQIGVFNASFGYRRNRYWLYEMDYITYNGSLYAGDMGSLKDDDIFDRKIAFDSYQAIYSHNINNEINDTNFSSIGYDNYSVSGQGIIGSIQPKVFEEGVLYQQMRTLTTDENGFEREGSFYAYPSGNGNFNNSIENNKLHFYFTNENSSYLKVTSDNWNSPSTGSSYNDILNFNTTNQNLNSTVSIDGVSHNGYNTTNKRLRTGSYIETYTNLQIVNGQTTNFIEAKGLIRNSNLLPSPGVGAYKITTLDGKTYHYSLPVYQREMFSRTTNIDKNSEIEFYEESQLDPYATHWLLTAITGPDYIDIDGDNTVNENDYGYWVEFEYGKWSDGFSWRTPTGSGYEKNPLTKQYQWGVKDIYYLDKIKTRTHTALFIKEIREDDLSTNIDIRNDNDPKEYEDTHFNSVLLGDDGNYYANGVYDAVPFNGDYNPLIYSTSKIYVKTNTHRSLKLNKIILLDNKINYTNISKSNTNQESPILAGNIEVDQSFKIYNATSGQFMYESSTNVTDRQWDGEFFGNILDIQDININAPDIENKALKIIDFNQNYNLSPNSPNSTAPNQGKLTLNSVQTRGKGGVSLIPSFKFNYRFPSIPYDNDSKDDWGFYKDYPSAWSLNKITTPLGEVFDISYEKDQYYEESAITSFVFDDKFEIKFTGEHPGNKWVTFRNHHENEPEEDIDFNNYFEVGQQSRINVQFVWDPSGNAGERVADIDKVCAITNVTNNTVTFQLPLEANNNYERSQSICHKDNWTYYAHFSDGNRQTVVERTAGFVEEVRENDCEEVSNDTQRVKIQFFSSKKNYNVLGGGIRVKNISLTNESDEVFSTTYNYNVPNSNPEVSSGTTSYAPSKRAKEVKYITEIPSPTVMYEFVTVTHNNSQGQSNNKTIYQFNVIKPMVVNSTGFEMGNLVSLGKTQNSNYSDVTIDGESSSLKLSKVNLIDNLSALGRLISKKTYNSKEQLINETKNEYLTNNEIEQGIIQETFKTYKKVYSAYKNDEFYLSSSTKTYYPNVLKSSTTLKNGRSYTTQFKKFDFLTGNVLGTQTESSDGTLVMTKAIPAYTKYSDMGSKVDNEDYKNMLSQQVANYTFIDDNGTWKPINVGITTWNNEWNYRDIAGEEYSPTNNNQKIWRKHKAFIWDGNIDTQGALLDYNVANDDGFNWNPYANSQPEPWKQISETTRYNHFSRPLEVKDINTNYAATKMWDNNTKIITTGNAAYTEMFSSGAEYEKLLNGVYYLGNEITHTGKKDGAKSHTGIFSNRINTGEESFKINLNTGEHRAGVYKISVWAHKDNYQNTRIIHNGTTIEFNGERVFAGGWVQLNHTLPLSSSQEEIYLTSINGNVYYDDYRFYPIESSLTTYVYNKYDELTFTLGANNLATKYQYDAAGRLIRVFQETINTPSITGGFKKAKEYRYNYKREITDPSGGGGDPNVCTNPALVYFSNVSTPTDPRNMEPTTAILNSGIISTITVKLKKLNSSDGASVTIGNTTINLQTGSSTLEISQEIVINTETTDISLWAIPGDVNQIATAILTIESTDCGTIGTSIEIQNESMDFDP